MVYLLKIVDLSMAMLNSQRVHNVLNPEAFEPVPLDPKGRELNFSRYGGFRFVMGVPLFFYSWMVYFRENPNKWMMEGGTLMTKRKAPY